jgi:hypothetical protein
VAYLPVKLDSVERGGKIAANIGCGLLIFGFALAFFGLGGVVAL